MSSQSERSVEYFDEDLVAVRRDRWDLLERAPEHDVAVGAVAAAEAAAKKGDEKSVLVT
jgi:hypothetical protein